jgi:RNA polymerase sigma factor (sigma-70 family)
MVDVRDDRLRHFLLTDYARVVGVVALVCPDRAAAEDAVQDALLTTWSRSVEPDSYTAWVTTVALNKARSSTRRLRAEQRAVDRIEASPGTPEETARTDVARALVRLSVRQRQVTVLRYWLDLDVGSIARVLGISEGTVKTQLSRARSALAPLLALEEADHAR